MFTCQAFFSLKIGFDCNPDTIAFKEEKFFPTSFNLSIPFQEVRLLKSEITGALLIGGAIPRTFIRELHCTPKVGFAFFTTSELAAILLKERDLDVIPLQCDTCQERTRDCLRCKMARKPISLQNQRERKMIKDALRFDAKEGVIETAYYPTESTFNDIFLCFG